MPFQKGHKLAKGGARNHSGPAKEEIRKKFREMLHESGAHERFKRILQSEEDTDIFLEAYKLSLDRGYGKPAIDVEVSAEESIDISALALLIQRVRNKDGNAG